LAGPLISVWVESGKWNLGAFKEAQPQNVGFDHYYGNITSSDDSTAWREPWSNPDLIYDPARKDFAAQGEVMAIVEGRTGEEAQPVFLYFATRGAHNDNYPRPDFAGTSLAKHPYKDVIVEPDSPGFSGKISTG